MKMKLIILHFLFLSWSAIGQNKIESFPNLISFVDPSFANSDNIFPLAFINIQLDSKNYKIPVSYSLLNDNNRNNFLNKSDNIDNYCFEVLKNGKCKPLFKKEALNLPTDWLKYLKKTKENYDRAKSIIDLNNYIKFLNKPKWWQDDATPMDAEGKPLLFICQLELKDITTDDCSLYIFFDKKRKLVRQIYQRD